MKTVRRNKLTIYDMDRIQRIYKIMCAVGTSGKGTEYIYPDKIQKKVDGIIEQLEKLHEENFPPRRPGQMAG